MRTKPVQLSVFAVAALAIVAVAAVMLLSGGVPAQASTTTETPALAADSSGGGNPIPQQQGSKPPRHAAPEPCPGKTGNPNEEAASVVSSGHYALFDVYWNPEEKELTNNSCPPTVTHTEEVRKKGKVVTEASDTRSPSSINIAETVIHIPNSAKVDLNTSTTYTGTMYPEVLAADNAENLDTDGDGTGDGAGDGMVWVLPACPPDGPSDSSLCIGFSAALLKTADWTNAPGSSDVTVEYQIDHVHQIDIDEQDQRYVLAYDAPEADDTSAQTAIWDTSDADHNVMSVAPGGYERPMWFFTSPGTFEFQVHIKGHPNHDTSRKDGLKPVSRDGSVTSDVREYIFHVGAEADLGVGVTVEPADSADTSLDPGDNVTITVTASNAGPDTATNTKVAVSLPAGLINPTSTTTSYESGTGVWTIGDQAMTDDDNTDTSDDSPTLTITATVAPETRGQELAVKATISASETVRGHVVPVLDQNAANDMATGSVTVASVVHTAPMLKVLLSVPENSAAGTDVGSAIGVMDPDEGETLTYALTGEGADNFTATRGDGEVQIQVATGSDLDYETTQSYDLTLTVSDGVDHEGNTDSSVDDSIKLRVNVTDVDEPVTATLTASDTDPTAGDVIHLTVEVHDAGELPNLRYVFNGDVVADDGSLTAHTQREVREDTTVYIGESTAQTVRFYVVVKWTDPTDGEQEVTTNTVDVTWQEAPSSPQ